MRAAIVGVLAMTGCSVYDPSLLEPACELRRVPGRPGGADGSADEELFFAFKDFAVDPTTNDLDGYDVDGLCSLAPDPEVECIAPHPAAEPALDGPGGIDNALGGSMADLLLSLYPDTEEYIQVWTERGVGAPMLRVRGWNGRADDPRVTASMSLSVFGTPAAADGSAPDVDPVQPDPSIYEGIGEPALPRWDGTDYWWARDDMFLLDDPDRAVIRDDDAYVASGAIVFRIPDRAIFMLGVDQRGFRAQFTDARAVVQMSEDRSTAEMTAFGRWAKTDALLGAQRAGFCQGTAEYDILVALLDRAADVRSEPGSGGEGAVCDAFSFAIAYSGVAAHWGGIAHIEDQPVGCELEE